MIHVSPIHLVTAAKTGLGKDLAPGRLASYHLDRLKDTIDWAKRGAYYKATLKNINASDLKTIDDFKHLPLTSEIDVQAGGYNFLCVSPSRVSRIITLNTSGTTGHSKRIFFTEYDQEQCIDFFAQGMTTMVGEGDIVGIFLGPEIPGGTVDLLNQGLKRIKALPVNFGVCSRDAGQMEKINGAACLVGFPVHLLQLAKAHPGLAPEKLLLCSDYASNSVVKQLKSIWRCEIFSHYGSTESGLGGGVECQAHHGYHLRDTDLFFEIVDPLTGQPKRPGVPGEVVFTTLNREAMPLIRYKTGDIAAMIESPCPCGSPLHRLSRIAGRFANFIEIADNKKLSIHLLDEIMFEIDAVHDYRAVMRPDKSLQLAVSPYKDIKQSELLRHVVSSLRLPIKIDLYFTDKPFENIGAKRLIAFEKDI